MKTRKCKRCQATYEYRRSTSLYCSSACRVAQSRARKKRSVHFRSETDDWATPHKLFDELDREYGFTLDVCASADNAKCERFYTIADDGLTQPWHGVCWMNPPYGRTIGRWVHKARQSSREGATVVCLLPARTDTAWWHDEITPHATEIRFLRGRLHFNGASSGAPFPSAIVVFRPPA